MADDHHNGGAQHSAAAARASHAHTGGFEACSPDPVVFLEFLARLPTAELVQLQQQARDMLPSLLAKETALVAQEKTLLAEDPRAAATLPSGQDAPATLPTEAPLYAPDTSGHKEDTGNGAPAVRAKLFLSATGLPPKDKNLIYGATSDPYLIIRQGGKEVVRTPRIHHTLCPKWDIITVKLIPKQNVVLECWDYDMLTADDLMGSATVPVEELLTPGAKIQLEDSRKGSSAGVITVNSVKCQMQCTERCSIVNMMQERVHVHEGDGVAAYFHVFRVHNLDQRVCVTWKTSVDVGTAQGYTGQRGGGVGRHHCHYAVKQGTVIFEPGVAVSSFDVPIFDNDLWEPIRDFGVQLLNVEEGEAVIGCLDTCICDIVDDDLYPQKWERGVDKPLNAADKIMPNCSQIEHYLTVDDVSDFTLIRGVLLERWKQLYPSPCWAVLWCAFRAFYHMGMSLLLVFFIDKVWMPGEEEETTQGWDTTEPPSKTSGFEVGYCPNFASDTVACRMGLAILGGGAVIIATLVQSYTETWIINDIKCGLSGKQLRDWIVTQLLWVDAGRRSTMRAADYLNAATSEVETAAAVWEMAFPALECVFRLVLRIALIFGLQPEATPSVVFFVSAAGLIHWWRANPLRELLKYRIQTERQYVSSFADVAENPNLMRGVGITEIRSNFNKDSGAFAQAHYQALKYSVVTKEIVELAQGAILAACFIFMSWLVNIGLATPGQAAGIIASYLSASSDIAFLSEVLMKMKFSSEGMRMIGRILNFPTEAHTLAAKYDAHRRQVEHVIRPPSEFKSASMERHAQSCSSNGQHGTQGTEPEGSMKSKQLLWSKTISLNEAKYICSHRKSLQASWVGDIAQRGKQEEREEKSRAIDHICPSVELNCEILLGGIIELKGSTSAAEFEAVDIAFRMIMGLSLPDDSDRRVDGPPSVFRPPCLMYSYVPEVPVLVEGSILRNLMMGDDSRRRIPTEDEAWKIAKLCGLPAEFLHAPGSFKVGKNGSNLPIHARQIISIARGLLTGASVIMLHNPLSLLSNAQSVQILQVFRDFVEYGGLFPLLEGKKSSHSTNVDAYLLGQGTPSVIISGLTEGQQMAVDRVVSVTYICKSLEVAEHGHGEVKKLTGSSILARWPKSFKMAKKPSQLRTSGSFGKSNTSPSFDKSPSRASPSPASSSLAHVASYKRAMGGYASRSPAQTPEK